MSDRRPPGFNVDLGFYDSEEVLSIPRKLRAAAVGVWTLAGAYSASKLTDGVVQDEKLRELGCTPAIRAALMATQPEPLWITSDDHPNAIRFTRWAKWQRTCAEVKAYKQADAERKRRAREASRNTTTSYDPEMSERTTAGRPQNVRADSGNPRGRARARQSESESKSESSLLTLVEGGPGGEIAKPDTSRGIRLPDEWVPNPDVVAQMRSDHPHVDLKAEHAKFIDYWRGRAGKDARKADWNATWRNWIRRASEQSHNGRAHAPPNGIGKPSLKALGYQTLADEIIAEMDQP